MISVICNIMKQKKKKYRAHLFLKTAIAIRRLVEKQTPELWINGLLDWCYFVPNQSGYIFRMKVWRLDEWLVLIWIEFVIRC